MLQWYGGVANSADYESILTSDYFSSQELVYASPPKLVDTMNLVSESEEISSTETGEINEFDDVNKEERTVKKQKTQWVTISRNHHYVLCLKYMVNLLHTEKKLMNT